MLSLCLGLSRSLRLLLLDWRIVEGSPSKGNDFCRFTVEGFDGGRRSNLALNVPKKVLKYFEVFKNCLTGR